MVDDVAGQLVGRLLCGNVLYSVRSLSNVARTQRCRLARLDHTGHDQATLMTAVYRHDLVI